MPTLTDVQWIFVVIAGLYLFESLVWVRSGVVPFTYVLRRFGNPIATRGWIGNDRGTLLLSGSLPTDAVFLTQPLPLSMGAAGVCGFVAAAPLQRLRRPQSGLFVDWEALRNVRQRNCDLMVSEGVLCTVGSARHAAALREKLVELANLPAGQRIAALDTLHQQPFDFDATRNRWNAWRQETRRLSWATSALFFWIFGVGLLHYYNLLPIPHGYVSLIAYLAIGLVLWWWAVLEAWLSHRKLYRDNRSARWKLFFMAMLSPVVPLRTRAYLARDLFEFVHPLVFALATREPQADETLHANELAIVKDVARDAEFPQLPLVPAESTADAEPLIEQERQRNVALLSQLLERMGIGFERCFDHIPDERDTVSYCPRCLAEYTVTEAECNLCGGRKTIGVT